MEGIFTANGARALVIELEPEEQDELREWIRRDFEQHNMGVTCACATCEMGKDFLEFVGVLLGLVSDVDADVQDALEDVKRQARIETGADL